MARGDGRDTLPCCTRHDQYVKQWGEGVESGALNRAGCSKPGHPPKKADMSSDKNKIWHISCRINEEATVQISLDLKNSDC